MNHPQSSFEAQLRAALANPEYQGHPLHELLRELCSYMEDELERMERITRLSDSFQSMARQRELGLQTRFDQQIKRLTRITRISDHYQAMLREASTRDPLTNALNRRALMDRLQQEASRSQRSQVPLCVALVDVDHFKQINDRYGHDVGDRVLIALSHGLTQSLRNYDTSGRWGGEEFLVILPDTGMDDAGDVLERVLAWVRDLRTPSNLANESVQITVSAGLAAQQPGQSVEGLLRAADTALYAAKQQGRDRVVVAS